MEFGVQEGLGFGIQGFWAGVDYLVAVDAGSGVGLVWGVQGYLAQTKTLTPLEPSLDPRHRPTVGSPGDAFSYQGGTPVEVEGWDGLPCRPRCPNALSI